MVSSLFYLKENSDGLATYPFSLKGDGDVMATSVFYLMENGDGLATSPFSVKGNGDG